MRPSANNQEGIGASGGTKLQRGLGEGGVQAPGYTDSSEPSTKRTQVQWASIDVAFFSAQLTDNNFALSTGKKGSGPPKGPRPEHPNAFSTGEEASSPSIRQASKASAPANGSTRTRASTNGWKSDFSLSLRKFGPCRWTFLWIDCFLGKSHRSEGAEIQLHCRAPTHRRS